MILVPGSGSKGTGYNIMFLSPLPSPPRLTYLFPELQGKASSLCDRWWVPQCQGLPVSKAAQLYLWSHIKMKPFNFTIQGPPDSWMNSLEDHTNIKSPWFLCLKLSLWREPPWWKSLSTETSPRQGRGHACDAKNRCSAVLVTRNLTHFLATLSCSKMSKWSTEGRALF